MKTPRLLKIRRVAQHHAAPSSVQFKVCALDTKSWKQEKCQRGVDLGYSSLDRMVRDASGYRPAVSTRAEDDLSLLLVYLRQLKLRHDWSRWFSRRSMNLCFCFGPAQLLLHFLPVHEFKAEGSHRMLTRVDALTHITFY